MRVATLRRLATLTASVIVLAASVLLYLHPPLPAFLRPTPASRHTPTAGPRIREPISSQLRLIQPLNAEEAVVWVHGVGVGDRLYATRDEGATWTLVALPNLGAAPDSAPGSEKYGFQAIDLTHLAVFLGHGMMITRDGGRTWKAASLPPGHTFGLGTQFIDPNTGWYFDLTAYPGQAAQPTSMWWTNDGARSWQELWQVDQSNPVAGEIPLDGPKYVLGFSDPLNGWLTIRTPAGAAAVLRTRDGGHTWATLNLTVEANYFEDIMFLADGSAILVGRSSTGFFALVSLDRGETWSGAISLPRAAGTPGRSPNRPAFADRSHWMVASDLSLNVTTDGGRTWTTMKPSFPASITAIHDLWFFGDTGWATATDQSGADTAVVTADGGRTWQLARVPSLS